MSALSSKSGKKDLPFFARLRKLAICSRAVGTVELALVAPFLCAMTLGITDVARAVAFKLNLQQAANRGLEYAVVGTNSDATQIQSEAASAAGVTTDHVTVTMWLECDGTAMPNLTDICTAGQETARYVDIEVNDSFEPTFSYGPLGQAFAGADEDGKVPMAGTGALRIQ